jgi:Nucleotidyl transferase AbiEii toxin, Type IV TA system
MSRPTRADPAGRVYLDLQNQARRQQRGTQELLTLYVLERFLARLSTSAHADRFILKGGMLLAALPARRPTADLDLMATQLANDGQTVLDRIVEIAAITPGTDDGVTYRTETARARTIRESDLYTGVRISMDARVAAANVKLALDINFGDPITPAPELIDYPGSTARHGPRPHPRLPHPHRPRREDHHRRQPRRRQYPGPRLPAVRITSPNKRDILDD